MRRCSAPLDRTTDPVHTARAMSVGGRFEELDRRPTPMGEISLRRRFDPTLQVDVYEAKLDEDFLMSSAFTVAEIALADVALGAIPGADLDVVVGGLGLGYTARAVLDDPRVGTLTVVEALDEVIEWHRRGLLPLSQGLTWDARCTLVKGDFFAMVDSGSFGIGSPDRLDAILVDIDHTPRHLLHPSHATFYEEGGQRRLAGLLGPMGVYALWSDDRPDPGYISVVERVFASCEAHIITFPNPLTGGEAANTVYVATMAAE